MAKQQVSPTSMKTPVGLSMTRLKVGILIVVFVAATTIAALKLLPDLTRSRQGIDAIVANLQKRSLPAEGRWVEKEELSFDRFSASSHWEIEWDGSWDEYRKWIGTRFGEFKIEKGHAENTVSMWKRVSGDTLWLTFEPVGVNPLRVRVKFRGLPS